MFCKHSLISVGIKHAVHQSSISGGGVNGVGGGVNR